MDTKNKMHGVLQNLDSVELELLQQNVEYSKQYLIEEGFDVAQESEYVSQYLKKLNFHVQAISNKRKDHELFDAAYNRLKEAIKENSQKSTQLLLSLLQSKSPAVHYRKLDKWADDEIREVLADIDLLKLMEELSKDK